MGKISQKTRVIIYIAIAIAVIVIGSMAVLSQKSGGESLLGEKLELGQQYLVELSYDKAVLEFTDAINIEPKSADAYIGLAEAYKGLGDTEKARKTLEKGYELTGDERIKALLEELDKAEGVTAETTTAETTAATETTTEITTEETTVPETTTVETTAVETTTTAEITTTVVREYTNDELAEAVRLLIKNPDANVDQALLDNIIAIYIWGDELISCEYIPCYSSYGADDGFTLYYDDGTQKTYKYGHIDDLNFLKKLHNIKFLEICFNEINDINPPAGLTNLPVLNLVNDQISDISPLSGLTNLTSLCLYDNQISDISPLSELKNLTFLGLGDNQISDISPLSGLTNLTYLHLGDNPISQTDLDKLKDALPTCEIVY